MTRGVLEQGSLSDLLNLVELGGNFQNATWNNSWRVKEWSEDTARQWLEIMFDHGWDGTSGRVEALLNVAQFHPALVEMWARKVPKTWHTRRNWLDGQIIMNHTMTPERMVAWMGVGATHATTERLGLDPWMKQAGEDEVCRVLLSIHEFMAKDKTRRRVRGEPHFRDWPWAQTLQTAIENAKPDIVKCVVDLCGPASMEQVIRLVARSRNPVEVMGRVRQWGWKLPHPGDKQGVQLLSEAIVQQAGVGNPGADREAFAIYLIEQGYGGQLPGHVLDHVEKTASPRLISEINSGQLRNTTPAATGTKAHARRRI